MNQDNEKLLGWYDEWYKHCEPVRNRYKKMELYYRSKNWDARDKQAEGLRPVTPCIFTTLENMLADIMDAYPQPTILGQEQNDDALAEELTEVLRSILARRNYRKIYREKSRYALKRGSVMQEVFWNSELSGIGDIDFRVIDPFDVVFDPIVGDLQDCRAIYIYSYTSPELIQAMYSKSELSEEAVEGISDYDELTSLQAVRVIECYYKEFDKADEFGRMPQSVFKKIFVNRKEVWASKEPINNTGKYPFILEPFYEMDDDLIGLGAIDVLAPIQDQIDEYDRVILENSIFNAKPRPMIAYGSGVDIKNWLDADSGVIVGNDIGGNSIGWAPQQPLPITVMNQYQNKLDIMKEESGQNSFNWGQTGGGVTSYSAISALQEQGSKRSRLNIEQMYDYFADLMRLIIEFIRDFYDEQRIFKITNKTVAFSGEQLKRDGMGIEFDVKIEVEQANAFKTMAHNEVVLQMSQGQIITPEEALELLIIPMKDKIMAMRSQPQEEPTLAPEQQQKLAEIDSLLQAGQQEQGGQDGRG